MSGAPITLGRTPLDITALRRVARQGVALAFDDTARSRIAEAHALLMRLIEAGTPIYGVTTGLGAAVDVRIEQPDAASQHAIPLARAVGVGREARADEVRAIVAARLSRIAVGHSGLSWPVAQALQDLLAHHIHPVIPLTGSVGEGALPPLAAVALALLGQGEVDVRGTRQPASEALAAAGLAAPRLSGKDGLALLSSNAASVGLAALALADVAQVLHALEAATALSYEAYRANLAPLSEHAARLHPVPSHLQVTAALRGWLEGSDLQEPHAARQLQDPLSLRCAASVLAAARQAWRTAREINELELNSSDDNPAVIVEAGAVLPNANFDATQLALSFEQLGLALARVAAITGERVLKLMSPASSGLPRFLVAPNGPGVQTGLATLQKTVSALVAEIGHLAQPMGAVTIAVADRVEDYASQAMRIVTKTAELIEPLRHLAAIELLAAAQAVDLRLGLSPGLKLGRGTAALHSAIRERVTFRERDRPATADVLALSSWIAVGGVDALRPWSAMESA